jgi:hypothetical protein
MIPLIQRGRYPLVSTMPVALDTKGLCERRLKAVAGWNSEVASVSIASRKICVEIWTKMLLERYADSSLVVVWRRASSAGFP